MAKPTMQDQFHRDLKTVKRAARLAATYWLTNGDGVDLQDDEQRTAFLTAAKEYAESQFAKGSDAKHLFEATLTGLFNAGWLPGQYKALLG